MLTGSLVQYDNQALINMYLSYVNEFLTIDRFAEYHDLTRYEASRILDLGRISHEREVLKYKQSRGQHDTI
jgi:hypothetical protein